MKFLYSTFGLNMNFFIEISDLGLTVLFWPQRRTDSYCTAKNLQQKESLESWKRCRVSSYVKIFSQRMSCQVVLWHIVDFGVPFHKTTQEPRASFQLWREHVAYRRSLRQSVSHCNITKLYWWYYKQLISCLKPPRCSHYQFEIFTYISIEF